MKHFWLIILTAMMFLLCSCETIELNPEKLYEPPKLSQKHKEIYKAIEEKIGQDYILKYPGSGDYRSAIVLSDIDADGTEEAIVFYGKQDSSTARIIVLDDKDSGWTVTCDVTGYGENIDRLILADIGGNGKTSVIVGFNQNNINDKTMIIYEYTDNRLELVYIRDYSELSVVDIDMDQINDIVVLNNNYATHNAYARILKKVNGVITEVDESYMNEDVVQYVNIQSGKIKNGNAAVYVDSKLASGSLMTEVLTVENGSLVNKIYGMDNELVENTIRDSSLGFQDINGDGIFEIPVRRPLPDSGNVYVTYWQQLDSDSLVTVTKTLDNLEAGYRIEMPKRWEDNIYVKNIIENTEWIVVTMGLNTNGVQYEVLKIRVYSGDDVIDQFALEEYTLYKEKGNFKYYVNIPELYGNGLAITESEFENMFKLID